MKYERVLPLLVKLLNFVPSIHPVQKLSQNLSCTPFFIIGSGRNGSTLLAAMLNKHTKLMVPPEQFFLHMVIIKFRLYNFLPWKDLVKILLGEVADNRRSVKWNLYINDLFNYFYTLPSSERTLRKIIDEVFVRYGKQKNISFEIWGDKSPLTTVRLNYIFPVFTDAKYIFLLRDGRDVVSSYVSGSEKYFQKYASLEHAAWLWNHSIKRWDWLQKKVKPSQLFMLKYEDLVTEPGKALEKLLNFLTLEFEEKMFDFHDQSSELGVDEMPHHQNLKKALNPDSIGKWKERLDSESIRKLMSLIQKNLERFGYI